MTNKYTEEERRVKLKEIASKRRTSYAYVPHRLSIDQRPELYAFPLNVLFAAWRLEEDKSITTAHAVYEPQLSSYTPIHGEEGQRGAVLQYLNKYNRQERFCVLTIFWDATNRRYMGIKNVNGEDVAEVHGDDWQLFFVELTSKGLYNGEACIFGTPDEKDAVIDYKMNQIIV